MRYRIDTKRLGGRPCTHPAQTLFREGSAGRRLGHLKVRRDSTEDGVCKQFCFDGHELTPENSEINTWMGGKLRVRCKVCRNEERRKRAVKNKEKALRR